MAGSSARLEASPLFAAEMLVGLSVVDELLLFRIPAELATEAHGDIAQMAGGGAAVLAFNVRDRRAPSLYAIEKVSHVIDDRI